MEKYKYDKGYIFNSGCLISEQIKIPYENKYKNKIYYYKGYKIKCNIHNYIFERKENAIHNDNVICPICNGDKVIKGINSFNDIHPELTNFLKNKEDGDFYSRSSNVRIECVCPICKKEKIVSFNQLSKSGFNCGCSSSFSFPNRMMYSLLTLLKIDFYPEKIFEWGHNKRHDFFLPDYSCIIEMNGEQHYSNRFFEFKKVKNINLEKQKENDNFKRENALKNGIKNYIEIDCSGATFKLISKEILKSRLLEIIDVNKKSISFSQWEKTSLSSVELEVINYYNNNTKKLNEISDFFKISEKTIRGYLNRGVKSGICLYDPIREKNKGLLNGRKGNNYLNRDYFRKYEFFAVKWVEKNIVFKNPYEASIILREKYNIITTYYKIAYVALGKIKTTKGQKFVRV